MMFQKLFISTIVAAAHLSLAEAIIHRRNDGAPPVAFDGQYMTAPTPGPNNNATEWWYFQVVGDRDPTTGIVPSFEAVFYLGFAFTLAPGEPRYQFDVSGVYPNGTAFYIGTPVDIDPKIFTSHQNVVGDFGNATFALGNDSTALVLTFDSSDTGIEGTVVFEREKTSAHVPQGPTTQGSTYFSSLAHGQTLNSEETTLYTESGWVIEFPRAKSVVELKVDGASFTLNGMGYHDHNWAPVPFDQIVYTWVLGLGSCGPYDLGYFEARALNSIRAHDLVQGSLAYEGEFLQVEAHLYGDTPKTRTVDFELTGVTVDPVNNQTIPTGVNVAYTLSNGTIVQFNLTNSVTNPALPVYHRWRLTGTGGVVGGEQHECNLIGEWLNPGLAVYTEGQSVFADSE